MKYPIAERVISVFAPHNCLLCNREGSVVCEQCQSQLARVHRSVCYRCNALSQDFVTCTACRHSSPLRRVWVASRYESYVKELIAQLKFERVRSAYLPLAYLIENIVISHSYDYIVPVPSATKRFRGRGYNPPSLIAGYLSKEWQIPVNSLLARHGQARQVGKSRRQRLEQLDNAYYVTSEKSLNGKSVLLIDDVITTGATLEHCALALKKSGVKRIEAAVIAR